MDRQIMEDFFEHVPVMIAFYDKEQNLVWANKAYLDLCRLPKDKIKGRKCWEAFGFSTPCKNCPVVASRRTGEPQETEIYAQDQPDFPKGKDAFLIKAVPLKDRKGNIKGIIESAVEISKQKHEEKLRLAEAEARFEVIAEYALDAIIIINEKGRIEYFNPAAEKMFGYSASDVVGKKVTILMPKKYLKQYKKGFEMFKKTDKGPAIGKVLELTAKQRSGATIPIEIAFAPFEIKGKFWATVIIRDIRKRKKQEKRLQEKVRILSSLYEESYKLTKGTDLFAIAKDVVRAGVKAFGFSLASIYYAEKDGSLKLISQYPNDISYPREVKIRWDKTLEGQGPSGRAIRSGLPEITKDILNDPCFSPWKDKAVQTGKIRSSAAFPLVSLGRTFGILNFYSQKKGYFTKERVHYLQSFANLAATALEKAYLLGESQERLQKITALRNIDMAISGSLDIRVIYRVALDEIVSQLKIDAADILDANPYAKVLKFKAGRGFRSRNIEKSMVPFGDGTAGRVATEKRVIHIPHLSKIDPELFTRRDLLKDEGFVSYYGAPLISKGNLLGVLEIFHRSEHQANSEWQDFLQTLAGQVSIAIDNASLVENLRQEHMELIKAYDQTIEGWGGALSLKEEETAEHSERVTESTLEIAKRIGIRDDELVHIRRGAFLHDIGKIGIPDSILLKQGRLTDEEWEAMKKHPVYALEMLSPISYLSRAIDIPYCHHERWDGKGYPRGLKGKQIPLGARIFAVVDVWDALTSNRPYRKAWSKKATIKYIRENSGKQFDPEVVEHFLQIMDGR